MRIENAKNIIMKKTIGILGLVVGVFLSVEGMAQKSTSPLQHPANYKTQSMKRSVSQTTSGTGVLVETEEAVSYKQPQTKRKTQRVSLETSGNPKRNYKMSHSK